MRFVQPANVLLILGCLAVGGIAAPVTAAHNGVLAQRAPLEAYLFLDPRGWLKDKLGRKKTKKDLIHLTDLDTSKHTLDLDGSGHVAEQPHASGSKPHRRPEPLRRKTIQDAGHHPIDHPQGPALPHGPSAPGGQPGSSGLRNPGRSNTLPAGRDKGKGRTLYVSNADPGSPVPPSPSDDQTRAHQQWQADMKAQFAAPRAGQSAHPAAEPQQGHPIQSQAYTHPPAHRADSKLNKPYVANRDSTASKAPSASSEGHSRRGLTLQLDMLQEVILRRALEPRGGIINYYYYY